MRVHSREVPSRMSDEKKEQFTPGEGDTATAVKSKPAQTSNNPKTLPPFKVLLHNDDENSFEHVIRSIMKLTRLTAEDAIERTIEAHESGLSLLLTTHRERAELYQEQFQTFQIITTIEEA